MAKVSFNSDGKRGSFFIGFALTFASISSFVALSFWLGVVIHDFLRLHFGDPWRFYSISIGVWLATIYMYIINFLRPGFEKSLNKQLEILNLPDE